MNKEPTRQGRILDLYITNRPSPVKTITTVPSISDHEGAIVADSDIDPLSIKKKPRKYFIFAQAKWGQMKEDAAKFADSYLTTCTRRTVDENWEAIKGAINETITSHVPSKMTSTRVSHGLPET